MSVIAKTIGADSRPVDSAPEPSEGSPARRAWRFAAVGLLFGLGWFVVALVETLRVDIFYGIKLTYNYGTQVYPVILLALTALLFVSTRGVGRTSKTLGGVAIASAFCLLGLRVYATHIEPYQLQIREITIASPHIREPMRLAHISDIQTAEVGDWEARVFERVAALRPDLVIHTGDLTQPHAGVTHESERAKIETLVQRWLPDTPILNVQGNTDPMPFAPGEYRVAGMRTLHGVSRVIEIGGNRLDVLGLTYEQSVSAAAVGRVDAWVAQDPGDAFRILLGHTPNHMPRVVDRPIDLCLAGHTHGGQVRIPGIGPLMTATTAPRDWARGFREEGMTRLNVSAGVGWESFHDMPPLRFNCPPELTIFTLAPEPGS